MENSPNPILIGKLHLLGWELDMYNTLEYPLFLAVDVAKMIHYSVGHSSHMIENVNEHDKWLLNVPKPYSPTRTISASGRDGAHNTRKWFLTENGVYEVLMISTRPRAKVFKNAIKDILHDMRLTREEEYNSYFNVWQSEDDYEEYCDYLEHIGHPIISYDDFLLSRIDINIIRDKWNEQEECVLEEGIKCGNCGDCQHQ